MARILVIEDELLWQKTLVRILQRQGYEVILATSYTNSKQIISSVKTDLSFDLILLDLNLSNWGELEEHKGMDLLPSIRKVYQNNNEVINVIILTAHGDVDVAREALVKHKDIVKDFINKLSFGNGAELIETIQKYLPPKAK